MSEFWNKYEDWSLEAVVKGATGAFSKIVDDTNYTYLCYNVDDQSQLQLAPEHSSFAPFPDMMNSCINELEEAYKPFMHSQNNGPKIQDQKQMFKHEPILVRKYKKRKKYKKVVMHVSGKSLASNDKWAWRKYGQKPIKSSPFPRSYYRCSSSKECLARKQVEQSYKNPGMFIVTYSAEHCHGHPTKRSSLAGTVRPRYSSNGTTTTATTTRHVTLQTRHEDQAMKVKEEGNQRDNSTIDGYFCMPRDLLFDIDDFYQGLEDACEFVPDHSIIC